ncbi:MAG TPA: glycosyltransferase family 2 protein [Streptosporangiaceae bacterium]
MTTTRPMPGSTPSQEADLAMRSRSRPDVRPGPVLPHPPDDSEKHAYAYRNLAYLATILVIGSGCLIFSQLRLEFQQPLLWPFMIFTASYVIYQLISLPVNFTGRGFDLAAHDALVRAWRPAEYPSVDIFLPICGEPVEVLGNTWTAVAGLIASYTGSARAYVLDDGPSDEARLLCASFGFRYLRRPDNRSYKKSGNLRYAFARSSGEFVLILDADFAPRADLLAETLPYLDDPGVAIVQSPQFFRESPGQTWIENAAGAIQEVFYRSIQVARDRFGAAVCVGTSAVYRRAALQPQGGPTLIPYAEDVHTGLDVRRAGWSVRYLPVVLSVGICPDNLDAFVRQQYRWCTGNAGVVFSRRMWTVPMSIPARLTYISGFFYYAYTGLLTFFGPVIPIVLLAVMPGQVKLRNFFVLGPAMLTGFVLYPLWHNSAYGPSVWSLGVARGWAHVFAIWDGARGKTMGWHPSRTPGSSLRRFRIGVTW